MSKTCILQNHSSVNEKLFRLTLTNHAEYAGTHGYDMVHLNVPYEEAMRHCVRYVLELLDRYDTVFTVGSDVIFTDMRKPLESFWHGDEQIVVPMEGINSSPVNADTILWRKPVRCGTIDVVSAIESCSPQWSAHPWGLQAMFNSILEQGGTNGIRCAQVREMQSAPFHNHVNAMWCPGDFSIHFFCGDNEDKYRRCEHFLRTGEVLWWQVN